MGFCWMGVDRLCGEVGEWLLCLFVCGIFWKWFFIFCIVFSCVVVCVCVVVCWLLCYVFVVCVLMVWLWLWLCGFYVVCCFCC